MKLCRFDLASKPGEPRSGIVYGGKVYETDGTQPVAVHEWSEARLLAPIGRPPSIRLFSSQRPAFADWLEANEGPGLSFGYLNPSLVLGPQSYVPEFGPSTAIACKSCLAAVVEAAPPKLPVQAAEAVVIGLTLALVFYAVDLERDEMAKGLGIGRSHDVGIVVGPALTTPDELEPFLADSNRGRSYRTELAMKVNGEEMQRTDLSGLPWTLAEMIAFASDSAPIASGDVFLLAVGTSRTDLPLVAGDEVHLSCEPIGLLACRMS